MRADSYCTRCFWGSISLCVHTEGTKLRCLAETLRRLTRTCISQTRTNPTPNVCSPTAYRSEATLRHKKWHKRFNVALWNRIKASNVESRMCCGKCSEMRVGEGLCVSREALYVHQMVAGPSCVPNRPLTISRHTWASRGTPAFHPDSCTRSRPHPRSAPRTSGWTDASAGTAATQTHVQRMKPDFSSSSHTSLFSCCSE